MKISGKAALAAGIMATAMLALAGCSHTGEPAAAAGDQVPPGFADGPGGPGGPGGPRGGDIDKSGDAQLQALVANVLPRFAQGAYHDAETGLTIPYSLYVPQDAGAGPLPMVTFIADASTVGTDVLKPLKQGLGGLVWASPEAQRQHPALVLVPSFSKVTIDDHGASTTSAYIEATRRMIETVARDHGADRTRLYATGQSMGCMMFLLMSAEHPDLFAGQLFVSGQWDTAQLKGLGSQRFVYIVSAGDQRASAGQAALGKAFSEWGVPFGSGTIDGKASADAQSAAASAALAKGKAITFLTFKAGSVLPDGMTSGGMAGDHMYSFDPAYRIAPLRDWLFAQRLTGN